MTPGQLAAAVRAAAATALADLGHDPSVLPGELRLERPRNPDHGDYASTVALQAAAKAGTAAHDLAHAIAVSRGEDPAILSAEVAGPGFLNIRLSSAAPGSGG